jgi:predicted O-linked N-acetylglucosamine transferase (SPINDLY family)
MVADSSQQDRIRSILSEEGITANRIKLVGESDRAGHFTAYREIDIALDPFPHGGGMTTLDALWMGVPVVTWPGRSISSRLAAASLTALGLNDFIADDVQKYVELAVAKAADLDGLSRLRASLRERVANSAFGDCARYTRSVEDAYRKMWQRWCAGQKARPDYADLPRPNRYFEKEQGDSRQ